MNSLDLLLLLTVFSVAVGGYRLGFLTRAASWIGMIVGFLLSALLIPVVIRLFDVGDPWSRFVLALIFMVVGAFLGFSAGLLAGSTLRRYVPRGPLRVVDRSAGALAGIFGFVLLVWLLVIPVMANQPGWPAQAVRNSSVARAIDRNLGEPPDSLHALERLIGQPNFPKVFEGLRPAIDSGPPPATSGLSQAVVESVAESTVRIEGRARCDRIQDGSGFVVAPETVVTNAHVVAGDRPGISVYLLDVRRPFTGTVTVFDTERDLAVLHVPGLDAPALAVGDADVGTVGAVFGHPGGQPELRVAPARVTREVDAIGRDLYDRSSIQRDVYILAASLEPGDSGSAFVDGTGKVVGVAFAIAPDRPDVAYALTSTELRAALALDQGNQVSTGACLAS